MIGDRRKTSRETAEKSVSVVKAKIKEEFYGKRVKQEGRVEKDSLNNSLLEQI